MAENNSGPNDPLPDGASAPRPADFARGSTDFTERAALPFTVVGLGGSAGGLQAFTEFFGATRDDSGMAFVVIQHLPPTGESVLADLLTQQDIQDFLASLLAPARLLAELRRIRRHARLCAQPGAHFLDLDT